MRRGRGLAVANDRLAAPAAHGADGGGVEDGVAAAAGDGDVADLSVGGDLQAEVNRAVQALSIGRDGNGRRRLVIELRLGDAG